MALPLAARDRSVAAGRQGPSIPSFVSGVVSSVNGNTISLANGAVTIDASAATIITPRGPGSMASVTFGAHVTAAVAGDTPANAPLHATHITVVTQPDLTLAGLVQSVDRANRTFVVLGRTVHVTDATTLGGRGGNPTQVMDAIAVNSMVSVAVNVSGGRLVADTIYGPVPPPTVPSLESFEAIVQSIGANQWVLQRDNTVISVKINERTIITGSPAVGDRVRVATSTDSTGARVAVIIARPIVTPPTQPTRSIVGTILGKSATAWTLQERDKMIETVVEITSETKILPGSDVGVQVHVVVEVRNNRLIAVSIGPTFWR